MADEIIADETVGSLCEKAQQAVAKGENEAARQIYLQALGLQADAPDVHYGLATVCFLLKDLDSAAYHFKEVTRIDPLRAVAYINLGAVYNRMDMLDEALPVLRRGIQLDHNRAEGYYNLGIVHRRKGQPELAITAYREAVRLNPRMADAHFNVGNIYLEREQHGMALAHYKQALALRPNWDKALKGLEQCEAVLSHNQAMRDQEYANMGVPEPSAGDAASDAAKLKEIKLDSLRHVDPAVHGLLLTSLHKTTVEAETISRSYLKIMEKEIEPIIKELSNSMLYSIGSMHDLEKCLEKFAAAITNMRGAQQELTDTVHRAAKLGVRMLKS